MPSINIGIIYATGSKIIRKLVVPDVEPNATAWLQYCGPGETFTLLARGSATAAAVRARVSAVTATAVIPTGRCCVIDGQGHVINVINADPALYSIPSFSLVLSDLANINDHYNVEITNDFSRRYAVALIATRIVTSIAWLPLVNPTSPDGLHFIVSSQTLQINDIVPAARVLV